MEAGESPPSKLQSLGTDGNNDFSSVKGELFMAKMKESSFFFSWLCQTVLSILRQKNDSHMYSYWLTLIEIN